MSVPGRNPPAKEGRKAGSGSYRYENPPEGRIEGIDSFYSSHSAA